MQSLQKKVPQSFELMGQRKGFVRYMTPDLRALVKQHAEALEDRETALTGILQVPPAFPSPPPPPPPPPPLPPSPPHSIPSSWTPAYIVLQLCCGDILLQLAPDTSYVHSACKYALLQFCRISLHQLETSQTLMGV